jgi:hypothetical protein
MPLSGPVSMPGPSHGPVSGPAPFDAEFDSAASDDEANTELGGLVSDDEPDVADWLSPDADAADAPGPVSR